MVLDYKSGGSDYYRDSVQLAAYAVALEEAGTSVAGYAYLCHIYAIGGIKYIAETIARSTRRDRPSHALSVNLRNALYELIHGID
ncbi:hypothetical protein, partial [Acetomicrobium sp. S15 = DSM 107314]|uniref:hypothetical protein n=1 Tax=Acetomicrobium sp. S15 = DSM 107314 TaxID=2529858 RepID=UPI00406CC446